MYRTHSFAHLTANYCKVPFIAMFQKDLRHSCKKLKPLAASTWDAAVQVAVQKSSDSISVYVQYIKALDSIGKVVVSLVLILNSHFYRILHRSIQLYRL